MIKYLGLDYGTKRMGLAIGDSENKTAVVFGTVNNIDEIAKIIADEEIDVVVLGKPYSMVDKTRELPENFKKFVEELKSKISVEIIFEDERLSSKYADSLAGDKKTKAGRDEIAAMSILQGYLDKV
ncbi:Holliday junction resolvase RuvX [Candidatus Falkowbacteria bacterium CG10_big_fil_rev_8_21_14_0_10_43_11]|uniref:Putative pre-16S rRNA nuclease n=1 Tax=Candidatus Falkowbacteria bacterium CG10_big_fil_rev_8_21_14_0_10_43_11 TaxID=1974568 RepID=A0A2M6WLM0_9BACT|nr:MAG: Holliday junction resolvase RuvX [Candidatus Falkowbacteria bacterium CG10_big_fil_rev_8_21_14_0_10_43_11]